jgi:capsid protein
MILAPSGKPARQELRNRSQGGGNWNYYFEAAKRSGYRTWFYFPSLDPSDQATEFTREEIARKLNWLYNNCPAAAGAIDGLAEEIADTGIWPTATSSNPKFNRAVNDNFERDGDDPRFFDEASEETFSTAQKAIIRNIFMLHDFFGQLLRPGEGSRIPTMNFVPSWQVGDPPRRRGSGETGSNVTFVDGTRANEFGRISAYWVYTSKDRKQGVEVPAGNMLHFHDALWKGQRRGISPLTPAVRKLFSLDDLDRAIQSGELARQRVAYQITRGIGDDDEPTMVPGGEVVDTIEVENPDGTKTKNYIQRIVSKDGTDIDIADLGPGRKIEMVESTKSDAGIAWSEHMLADIARCLKFPKVYVFDLGGMNQGTEVRMTNKRIQRRKNYIRQHLLIPQFCRRWYNFKLWQDISSGRYDDIEGGIPLDWFAHRWNLPADDSVDLAREAHVYDDRVDSGKMTRRAYHAIQSEDWMDAAEEIIDERVAIEKRIEDKRAELLGEEPDYTGIAERISYDLIFRQSNITRRVAETAVDLTDDETTPPEPPPNSRNGNGSRHPSRV